MHIDWHIHKDLGVVLSLSRHKACKLFYRLDLWHLCIFLRIEGGLIFSLSWGALMSNPKFFELDDFTFLWFEFEKYHIKSLELFNRVIIGA
jgi:hypothetical protein